MANDMNTELMFSSKTDLWSTPQWLFDRYNEQCNFTLDVCASPENKKVAKYFSIERDGLKQDWSKQGDWQTVAWCNPPYGREVGKWVKKSYQEAQKGSVVVMLLPARTDTKWFHDWIYQMYGVEIEFLKGRLKFGESKHNAPFPSMIVTFRKNPIK